MAGDLETMIAASTNATRAASTNLPGVAAVDPQTILAAAQSAPTAADAVGQAQATAQLGSVATAANQLSAMDPAHQQTLWDTYAPQYQAQLLAMGFKPAWNQTAAPQKQAPAGGLFNDIGNAIGDVGHALSTGVGDALNVAGGPLRLVQHIGRVATYEGDLRAMDAGIQNPGAQGVLSGAQLRDIGYNVEHPMGGHSIFNPASWAQGWSATTNGAQTFLPSVVRQLKKTADPLKLQLATDIASGMPGPAIVHGFAAADQPHIVQLINSDSDVAKLVTQLRASKMSLGEAITGEQFQVQHPIAGKALSGSIDAVYDYIADPTMHVAAATKAAGLARWGMSPSQLAQMIAPNATSMEDLAGNVAKLNAGMGAVARMPKVAAVIQHVGGLLANGDAAAIMRMYPGTFGDVAQTLLRDGVDSPEKFRDWFTSVAGANAILTGTAARLAKGVAMVPHLSTFGWQKMAIKEAMQTSLENLASFGKNRLPNIPLAPEDLAGISGLGGLTAEATGTIPKTLADLTDQAAPHNLVGSAVLGGGARVARVLRHLTPLVANKPYLTLAGSDAELNESAVNLRRMLGYSLPAKRADQLTNLYVNTPDVGQRFAIAKGAVDQMLNIAGARSSAAGAKDADELLAAMQRGFSGETYSPLGLDKFADGTRSAMLDGQESTRVALPSFYEVHRAATAGNLLRRYNLDVGGWGHGFMNVWRPSVLLREAFPLRTSGDETLGYGLRNGVGEIAAARLARWQAKSATRKLEVSAAEAEGRDPQISRLASAVAAVAHHVPAPIMAAVKTPADLATAVMAEGAWKVFGAADKTLSHADYYEAARQLDKVWPTVAPRISALYHSGGGGYDVGDDLAQMMTLGGKPTVLRMAKGGVHSEAAAEDPLWRQQWNFSLEGIAKAKLGQAALDHIYRPKETQMAEVLKVLRNPDFQGVRDAFRRAKTLPDLSQVGVDATRDQADETWASGVVAHVNALVRSSDPEEGPILRKVVDEMRKTRHAPSMETLNNVAQHDLPKSVYGPTLIPVGKPTSILRKGMNLAAYQMDAFARQPNFLHAFTRARKDFKPWVRLWHGDGEHANSLLNDLSANRA
ncbi:MAG: hypothetical protein ACYCU7_18850, partial [Acidimicrobiales bacterium]